MTNALSTVLSSSGLLLGQQGGEFSDPAQKDFQFWEPGSTFWMPPQASEGAADADWVFYFIYGVSVFFFFLVIALMGWFAWRYRAKTPDQMAVSKVKHNTTLELTWTIIPLVLVVFMFYVGFRTYVRYLEAAPLNAKTVYAEAYKWGWRFRYPNGAINEDLHLEGGQAYQIVLESEDVTHSLYIPAFRVKKDAVPGRYNRVWFRPNAVTGGEQANEEYRLFCTEYCGTGHSNMAARVVVHSPASYAKWLSESTDFSDQPLHEQGRRVYELTGGCQACHSSDGSSGIGPSFAIRQPDGTLKSIYGKQEQFTDGSTLTVDEEYLRESIRYPGRKIVAGYKNQMGAYPEGRLSEQELIAVIEFIKSLDADYEPPPMPTQAGDEAADGATTENGDDGETPADDKGEAPPTEEATTAAAASPTTLYARTNPVRLPAPAGAFDRTE